MSSVVMQPSCVREAAVPGPAPVGALVAVPEPVPVVPQMPRLPKVIMFYRLGRIYQWPLLPILCPAHSNPV